MVEPSAAISVIETDLRRLVRVVLQSSIGENWASKVFDGQVSEKLRERLEEEKKRRDPATVPTDLTAYTYLYELRNVIEKRWDFFSKALGAKREFSVLMDIVEDFRNGPAHSRELLPYERALLEGIAGKVRTQITRYVSSTSPDAKHYPVIEWIRDSFGNELSSPGAGSSNYVQTGLRLQVGDTVAFVARGWDPQGRELTWRWGRTFASLGPKVGGTEVAFTWKVTKEDVGERFFIEIDLIGAGPYHRQGGYDDRVAFHYAVEPPFS